jgi:Icc-related predicted phosphoesterase
VVAVSDTHTKTKGLVIPDGDVLIHAGDWTYRGGRGEIKEFLEWFDAQPHKHKVFIAGNHEFTLDRFHDRYDHSLQQMVFFSGNENTHYLEDTSVSIEGVRFYGSPGSKAFGPWGFGVHPGEHADRYWGVIPKDTDVLITHGPPHSILDTVVGRFEHLGDESLRERVDQLPRLKAHVFGHIHSSSGMRVDPYTRTLFVNAAICDEQYLPTNKPQEFEI